MTKEEIVEHLMKKAGYNSRRQFAEAIGIPPTTLNSMLTRGLGKSSIDNVLKVCKGLGITVEELEEVEINKKIPAKKAGVILRAIFVRHESSSDCESCSVFAAHLLLCCTS